MKTYNDIYKEICSVDNLNKAYNKARKSKAKKPYVVEFNANLEENLKNLQNRLVGFTYKPKPLKKFIIRDPKTRTIHASAFVDRIVHHALVNVIEPIYEKIFISDSFASRKNKGTHSAVKRFEEFMRKVSGNGRLVKNAINNNQIEGYCLKADIKSYFGNVRHEILLEIIRKRIADENVIKLIRQILTNFDSDIKGKGMPLGNLTSQFFANVYLNELDYFVKHKLKAKYYIRYVDDFVIFHRSKKRLVYFEKEINNFLLSKLKIWLHPNKTKILALRNGVSFLGYKIFFHYKILVKRNRRALKNKARLVLANKLSREKFLEFLVGWNGHAKWSNSFNLRKEIEKLILVTPSLLPISQYI